MELSSLWLESYWNHILHCSFYTGIASFAFFGRQNRSNNKLLLPITPSSSSSSSCLSFSISSLLLNTVGVIATIALIGEFNYIRLRKDLPPGDSGLPIIGHILQWFQNPRQFYLKRYRRYGSKFTFNVLGRPIVYLTSEDDIQWAIKEERLSHLKPTMPAKYFVFLSGEHSISYQFGVEHRRLRKIFEPSFAPTSIQQYINIIDTTTQMELTKWHNRNNKNQYSTEYYSCSTIDWAVLAMKILFKCVFEGRNQDQQPSVNDDEEFEHLHKLIDTWLNGIIAFPIPFNGNRADQAFKARSAFYDIVKQKVIEFKKSNPKASSDDIESNNTTTSMMGRLCYGVDDDGKTLGEEQLIQNIMFLVLAGHDTLKGTFGAFAHYLVELPDHIRTLLLEEVMTFKEPLTMEQLKNELPILNAFIAETWRLIPPLDSHKMEVSPSSSQQSLPLEYKGYKFRQGVAILTDITCSGIINTRRYPNPMEFHLERWIPKTHPLFDPQYCVLNEIDYNNNMMNIKFRPFNVGSHSCLGGHFAKLEARIIFLRLLQNYDITISNDRLINSPFLQYRNDFKLIARN